LKGRDPEGWINRFLAELDVCQQSDYDLIDASTGDVTATVAADNYDWVEHPFFSADNAFLLAADPSHRRLAIWTLPIDDRPLLKMGLLLAISLIAAIAVFKSFRRRATSAAPSLPPPPCRRP
jgi:hypothetical protein